MNLYNNIQIARALQKIQISNLYPWQSEVLPSILSGKDTFILQATSGGKSLLYQLPAIMEEGQMLTIVVSPLRALQEDQVDALHTKGICAVLLNSDLSSTARRTILKTLPQTSLLYLAPEQLRSQDLLEALKRCSIARVVVDEAHVLPQSGRSFRKAYREVGTFIRKLSPRCQILACTATATPKERREIIRSLGMESPQCFIYPLRRDNLRLQIKRVENPPNRKGAKFENTMFHAVERVLAQWNGKGSVIVYAPTVKRVKHLHKWLMSRGWQAARYTGKMSREKRQQAQTDFLSGKKHIIVATNAFGLGINKSDVRLVIHAGLPLTLNGYVQEIGRAGRDGKKSDCILLYSKNDITRNERILKHSGGKKAVRRAMIGLKAMQKLLSSKKCIWKVVENFYGESSGKKCGCCSRCAAKR